MFHCQLEWTGLLYGCRKSLDGAITHWPLCRSTIPHQSDRRLLERRHNNIKQVIVENRRLSGAQFRGHLFVICLHGSRTCAATPEDSFSLQDEGGAVKETRDNREKDSRKWMWGGIHPWQSHVVPRCVRIIHKTPEVPLSQSVNMLKDKTTESHCPWTPPNGLKAYIAHARCSTAALPTRRLFTCVKRLWILVSSLF